MSLELIFEAGFKGISVQLETQAEKDAYQKGVAFRAMLDEGRF